MHSTRPLKRHVRALRILTCLQSGPQYGAKDFAQLFGVSRRTIYRDLDLLRSAGVEFRYDAEHDAYSLVSNDIRPPAFQMEDVALLALSANLSMLACWPRLKTATKQIVSKLLAGYPQQVRGSIARLLTACIPETTTPTDENRAGEVLAELFAGVQQRKQVRIGFLHKQEHRFTKIAPYRIVMGQGRWTLIGRSSWHRRTESFDSAHVNSAQVTEDPFAIPRGFRFRNVPMVVE